MYNTVTMTRGSFTPDALRCGTRGVATQRVQCGRTWRTISILLSAATVRVNVW